MSDMKRRDFITLLGGAAVAWPLEGLTLNRPALGGRGRGKNNNGSHIPHSDLRQAGSTGRSSRMNRTLKEATVRRYHYDSHHQLRQHIQTFLDAYNFAKRLKTLNGLTPFESV